MTTFPAAGLTTLVRDLARDTKAFVTKAIADAARPRDARLDAFERRLGALERRPPVTYKGVWAGDVVYGLGDLVTHRGSVWHSNVVVNRAKPGESPAWTLAVRRGQDGKDAPR